MERSLDILDHPSCAAAPTLARLSHLEQSGRAHAAADAHGNDDVADAAALAFDEGVAGEARGAHPVGMAYRDGAAVDVEPLHRDAEAVAAIDGLDGKGLVELPEANIVDLEAVPLQQLRHGEDRTDAHLVGLAAGDHHTAIDPERRQAALLGERSVHHDTGRDAVRELARV